LFKTSLKINDFFTLVNKRSKRTRSVNYFDAWQYQRKEVHLNVLIVESSAPLAELWQSHLQRNGAEVWVALSQEAAFELLAIQKFEVIILDVVLKDGHALSVSDMAHFRQPEARIIFVTNTTFFSDGSIFNICPNACAYLPSSTPPRDLASMVQHYARAL
jgi:DNA-binding NtrC family response regulator